MNNFTINVEEWPVLKLKLQRKYNHLTEEDLRYEAGQEEELLTRLARRLHRDTAYVRFTLAKEQVDLVSNRL
mgnify:CR=1 FL=1